MASGSKEKLVIVGDGEIAEMAYEYFSESDDYEIVAFSSRKKIPEKPDVISVCQLFHWKGGENLLSQKTIKRLLHIIHSVQPS